MLTKGAAKKVTVYVNEDSRYHAAPLYEAILEYLLHHGVAGATASRAMAGFGAHQVMHTTKIELLTEHLPVRVEFVESPGKVDEVLPGLYDLVSDGLIEVQDTTVVKQANRGEAPAADLPVVRQQGQAQMMRIFLGEADEWQGEPLYDAIIKRLRLLEVAGATVYRGILGYGAKGHTHKESFWHLSRDLPVMIAVVDRPEKLRRAAEAVEGMMQDGLIVLSGVEMVRLVHSLDDQSPEDPRDTGA